MQQHAPNHGGKNPTPVPDFKIKSLDVKWGGVSVTALKILCAEKDGLYLKSLMLHAWNSATYRGKFVPAKAWLITSPDAYRSLFNGHYKYIDKTTSITIKGFHPRVASKDIAVSGEKILIKEYLLGKTNLIKSMERTNSSDAT
eukprot:8954528-Ditylum_brightwellii.AAC.1